MESVKFPCKVIGSPDDLLEQIPELAVDYDYVIALLNREWIKRSLKLITELRSLFRLIILLAV